VSAIWGKISAGELAKAAGGLLVKGDPETLISGLSTDSRSISAGSLFWALKGERFDGHDFVERALSSGAIGSVVERGRATPGNCLTVEVADTLRALGDLARWWRASLKTKVAAVTGSAGKTTTKEMLFEVLSLCGTTLKTEGNLNNLIGLPLTVFRMRNEHGFAVLEMGMNVPGEIGRLTEICMPDVGLITNVGMAHLEGVGGIEGVARAKTELVAGIGPSSTAVLNGDDELLMKTAIPYGKRMITFGLGRENQVRADEIRATEGNTTFRIKAGADDIDVTLGVPGIHNVKNALCAAAGAIVLGAGLSSVKEGLERFKPVKGRLNPIVLKGGALLIDDTYNANPLSLRAALDTVKVIADRRKASLVVGLGDMRELGEESERAHLEAGRLIASLSPKYFFATGRFAEIMLRAAFEAGMGRERLISFDTPDEMGNHLARILSPGDVILLKASRKIGLERASGLLREKAAVGERDHAL
jgi:UDP-N-acetylmuramoyl-tripeptide--D-alanyl-D-alanine ligase